MSLHYRVKLKMLIAHTLPLRCYRKKLQNLFRLNCGLQIHQKNTVVSFLGHSVHGHYMAQCHSHSRLLVLSMAFKRALKTFLFR